MPDTQAVLHLLNGQCTLSLATTADDGTPRVAPVFYLADERLRLYWFSSGSSEHSRNLQRDASAAVTIHAQVQGWRDIRGVQMRGKASVVTDPGLRNTIIATYTERFHLDESFEPVIARTKLWMFDPDWVRYLDNSKYFGYQDEFELISPGNL